MTFQDHHSRYFAAVTALGRNASAADRDAVLLPLSCIPVLARDNHGYSYPVVVVNEGSFGATLYCVGAPSGWPLSKLQQRDASVPLAFDFGQKWHWTNFRECMDAIRQFRSPVAPGVVEVSVWEAAWWCLGCGQLWDDVRYAWANLQPSAACGEVF